MLLTNNQMQNGGFLGLLASLGIPLISSLVGSLMGKGLQLERHRGKGMQIDSTPRNYRRISISNVKKSKFLDYPISNFDIIEWVKFLKIKTLRVYLVEITLKEPLRNLNVVS